MNFQTQTSAKITVTQADIRLALAQYITANGLTIAVDELPANLDLNASEQTFLVEIVEDTSPARSTPARRAPAKKAEPKAELKVVPDPVVGSAVPEADVEAYRKKKEAEISKAVDNPYKEEATVEAVKPAEFKPEGMISNANEVAHTDSVDEGDDLVEEEFVPSTSADKDIFAEDTNEIVVETKKTTASIFDDEEPAVKPTAKITASIFD